MAKQLFEYAVIKNEKLDKDGEIVEEAEILVRPTVTLADSDSQVGMLASRAIDEEHMKDIDRLQVVIRPF